MKTKAEIKSKMLAEFLNSQRGSSKSVYDYFQYHIDNVDQVVEERIACLVNKVIRYAIYSFNCGRYTNRDVFGLGGDYVRELGLELSDLGDFPKVQTVEAIDKFIKLMNQQFEVNIPTVSEYRNAKNEYEKNPDDEDKRNIFEEIQRRNGQNIDPCGQYGETYVKNVLAQAAPKKDKI